MIFTDGEVQVRKVLPAYQQVADQLRDMIVDGALKPGSRASDEPTLAKLFGVGRSTVREALRILAAEGLIAITRGSSGGIEVLAPSVARLSDAMTANLSLMTGNNLVGPEELLEARALLEVPAAGMAAERRTDAQLEKLATCVESADASGQPTILKRGYDFHTVMMECVANPLLAAMTTPLFTVLKRSYLRAPAPAGFWDHLTAEHKELLSAITLRDARLAEELMERHLKFMRPLYDMNLVDILEEGQSVDDDRPPSLTRSRHRQV